MIFLKPVMVLVILILTTILSGTCNAADKKPYSTIPFSDFIALEKASHAVQKKEINKAVQILENLKKKKLLKNNDVHPVIFFTLGNYYINLNNLEKAENCYEEAVKLAPAFSSAWLNLASTSYDKKHYKRAGEAFVQGYETESHKENKKNARYLFYGASAYLYHGDPAKALSIFKIIMERHRAAVKIEWLETLIHIYLSLKRPKEALPHMVYLIKHTTGDKKIRWQENLLYQYIDLNMDDKALGLVIRLTREYPENPKWWKGLAHFHLKHNQYKKTLTALTIYGYLTPLTSDEKKLAADLNISLGIPNQAIKLYEKVQKDKSSQKLLIRIVEACRQAHDLEAAFNWTDTGVRKYPESTRLKMMKGELLFDMKRYQEAILVFEKLTSTKKKGRAWLMMGYSAWNTGDLTKARLAM